MVTILRSAPSRGLCANEQRRGPGRKTGSVSGLFGCKRALPDSTPRGSFRTLRKAPFFATRVARTMNNHLVNQLPEAQRIRLLAGSERVELQVAQILQEPGRDNVHAYLPEHGVVCMLALMSDRQAIEVDMVGRDGMVGTHLLLGLTVPPLRALVTVAGEAWRLERGALQRLHGGQGGGSPVLARYLGAVMAQTAQAAACARFHSIDQRLPRWLLMHQDRAASDTFRVTQELLASLLGVRRVSITNAAGDLQRRGLIHYHRAQVTVLDRSALEATACTCYASDRTRFFSPAYSGAFR